MIIKIINNQQGSTALLMSVVVLSSVLAVVLSASEVIRNCLVVNRVQLDSTRAYFASEAAAERILWTVRNNISDLSSCNAINHCAHFDAGNSIICDANCSAVNSVSAVFPNYKYYIDYDSAGVGTKLICYGFYSSSSRAVEISY